MADRRDEWIRPELSGPENDDGFSLEDILSEYGGGLEPQVTEADAPDAGEDLPFLQELAEPEPEPAPPPEEEPDLLEGLPAAVVRDDARHGGRSRERRTPAPPPPRPAGTSLFRRRAPKPEAAKPADAPAHPAVEPYGATKVYEQPPEARADRPSPGGTVPAGGAAAKPEKPPQPVSLEDVVGSTVDAVMTEERRARQRALFSRRNLLGPRTPAERPQVIGPEKALDEAAAEARARYNRRRVPPAALVTGILPALCVVLEQFGVPIPGGVPRTACLAACLLATGALCREAFTGPVFLCGVSALAALCDCAVSVFAVSRSAAEPYGAAACLGLLLAQGGMCLESRGMFDTFRAASVDREPPWMVTDTEKGACKQRGAAPGFYTAAVSGNLSARWQALFLPLTLAASVVFAVLSSVGRDRPADFFLNWSVILAAAATFSLPMCWGLPWARLARRLQKAGCAVAGWFGAERISRRRTMILTDGDLFPPGDAVLNGVRLYDMEMDRAVSLAAAVVRASGCGLGRIFEDLRRSELGAYVTAEDFSFYEEGGYSAAVRGDRVLLGTTSFLRKMGVPLPRDLALTTGMYLAVNGRLAAVFAVKYQASENVDFALKLVRTCRITPVLAVRDPNVTPPMLRRRYRREIKAEYPRLADRVALSEAELDRDLPRALLFREGLLPYAEVVVGSRRLCRGVRRATLLALFSSLAGMLLAFYLVFQAKYALLNPFTLLIFLLLWALPSYLLMDLL